MRHCFLALALFISAGPASGESPAKSLTEQVEAEIFHKTNRFRTDHGLPKLSKNRKLDAAASKFAKFMAKTGEYGHHADGKSPSQRVKAAGYQYCVVRENIAYRTNTGDVTAESLIEVLMTGWMESPPHRENMLAEYINETGVAVATSDDITYYAVAVFGRPESASITLKVTNETDQERTLVVETNGSKDEINLPAGTGVKMVRCFPAELSLKGREGRLTLDKSTDLVIKGDEITPSSAAVDGPPEPTK